MQVRLPGGWTFVYRLTAVESDGRVFEAEWLGEPGARVPRHTHPSQDETLQVVEGALHVTMNGEERALRPGEQVIIPAGVEHRWANRSGGRTRGVFQLRPAGMADFVFVQLDRAFGGQASALSTAVQTFILIGTHGQHTAWPIETLRFLVAPTARLFGYRSYYEPAASSEPSPRRLLRERHLHETGSRLPLFWKEEGTVRLVEHGAVQHLFESPKEELTAAYVRGRRG